MCHITSTCLCLFHIQILCMICSLSNTVWDPVCVLKPVPLWTRTGKLGYKFHLSLEEMYRMKREKRVTFSESAKWHNFPGNVRPSLEYDIMNHPAWIPQTTEFYFLPFTVLYDPVKNSKMGPETTPSLFSNGLGEAGVSDNPPGLGRNGQSTWR